MGALLLARYTPDQIEKMIAVEAVDVVIITSPDHTHTELTARAMDAGADVVLEKAMTIDLAGCRRIVGAVERTGRPLLPALNYRYSSRNAALKEVIASGEVGEVSRRPARGTSRASRTDPYLLDLRDDPRLTQIRE